jgi:tetratricopeptide (TPR) repeat protein
MDFGIARRISHQTGSTSTAITIDGTVAGTPDYMAPEQFEGKELGAATDVFALGVVLYEALTGRRPFSGEVAAAKAVHARTVPPSISTIQRGVPRDLDRVVSKCLEYDPNRRYQSAKQVSEDLRNGGRSLPKLRNLVRRISGKQPPTFATLLLFFAICGLTLLGVFITRRMQEHTIVPIAERDRVLVTDFQNLTGNPVFDGTIRDLVAQSLGQSSYLNVVSRSSAIDAVKRIGMGDVKEIDTNLGRQICIRENYNAFVTGQISRAGAGYVIAMLVMLPDKEIPIVTETENIHSPGEIYSAVDRLAIRTRRELGESSNSLENASRPLARVTTPSLEALRRYTDAMDHYGAREYARCISLSKDAIDLDANFAMAHLLLARAFEQTGDEVDSRAEFQKARENVGRVGEREKHLILAANFASLEMNEKAADEYQLLLDIYPDDIEALRGFAVSSYWAGRPDQAIAAQQKALTLSPHDVESYDNLMTLLIRTNRFSDALSVFQMAQSRNIHGTNLRFLAALGDWGNEDLDTAQKLLASLDDGTSTYWKVVSKLYTGRLLSYRGHITEAITAFRSGYALVDRPGWESWIPVFQYQIAKGELARGKTETARNECRKYCKSVEDSPTAGNLQRAAVLSISIGDVEFAKRFQKALGMQAKNHSDAFSEMELYTVTGDVYLVEGKFQLAIENQRKALAFISEFEADLGLAEACEHSKDWNCAIEAYTNYLKQKGEILRDDVGSDWSMAHYSLARVYFEAGDRASAIRLNEEFRRLFASGDSSLPILSESKQLANRLGNEAARK